MNDNEWLMFLSDIIYILTDFSLTPKESVMKALLKLESKRKELRDGK